jgi:hypothetical protein
MIPKFAKAHSRLCEPNLIKSTLTQDVKKQESHKTARFTSDRVIRFTEPIPFSHLQKQSMQKKISQNGIFSLHGGRQNEPFALQYKY